MIVWLARDKSGDLGMFNNKPQRLMEFFAPCMTSCEKISWWLLPQDSFPEVTWENSPQKYELDLCLMPIKKGDNK